MSLSEMTSKQLIFLDKEWSSRKEAIHALCHAMYEEGIVTDEKAYEASVWEREEISETGFENGIAIPHGKTNVVNKAAFAIARVKAPIKDWPSMKEDNQVRLIFLLAIPEANGDEHLRLLSTLSVLLMQDTFVEKLMNESDMEQFIRLLDKKDETTKELVKSDKLILVLTSCSAGIAHTYMAAEALEKAGANVGVNVLSEKQGANGIEDKISASDIKKADAVIFATDLPPKGKERFNGLPYVATNVGEPLKNADGLIDKALHHPDGILHMDAEEVSEEVAQTFWKKMFQGVQTGISYMIPVIVAAGLMIGIGQLGASAFGIADKIGDAAYATDSNQLIVILHFLSKYGNMIMKFMYPVFAAYMAYSIADRPGLVPGFIGGAFAGGLHYVFWGEGSGIPSGFFGALILGAVAGICADYLNKHIKLHKNLQAMKPMLIVPGFTVLIIFFLNFYIVDPVFGGINQGLQDLIVTYKDSGTIILVTIIAALTAFDLGGPVNKSAGAIAIGLAADHIFPLTARVMSIVIPPIGIGLATVIDKLVVKRRVFSETQRVTGTTSLILGFLAIGEGAIPFMLEKPITTVSINVVGAIIGSLTGVLLGAVQWYPLPAIWGWPLVENFIPYLIGLVVGIAFIAFANIFVRYYQLKRKENKA